MRAFPANARRDAGYQLYRVQGPRAERLEADAAGGAGVREIRVHADGQYRVLYLATRPDAVYVLHAFAKKRQTTPKLVLDLARARLKELLWPRHRD